MMAEKHLGIFKRLGDSEELLTEGKDIATIHFIKEIHKKTFIFKSVDSDTTGKAYAKVFLTDKRLLFLNLYLVTQEELGSEETLSKTGFSGTWFELPIEAINDIQLEEDRLEIYYNITSKMRDAVGGWAALGRALGVTTIGKEEKIALETNSAGMWKMQIENLMHKFKKQKKRK